MSGLKGTSKELQEISLVALMNDAFILARCCDVINENFYVDPSYKLIFKGLKNYYKKYMVVPSSDEFVVCLKDIYTEEYGDLSEIVEVSKKLYNTKAASDDFLTEKVIEFIRRNKAERAINKTLDYIQGGEIDLDQVSCDLSDAMFLNFSKSKPYNLSDISSIKTVKEKALGSTDNPIIVKFFIDKINQIMQYKGLIPGTLNMVTAPPGRGKTTMMINQGVSSAKQGFNVLHVFLGDMSEFDGLVRYTSCIAGTPTSDLVDFTPEELGKFIAKWNMSGVFSKVEVISYAADELTASQLIEEITTFQRTNRKHYDVIIVDYDENISKADDNIYESGGQIYNKLALFSVTNKSVIFVASQPKTEYWKQEIIPLEAASESSKKQKIIDLMITLGKPSKSSSVGTIHIAKNRRGEDGKIYRIKISGSNARMTHISEDDYLKIKSSENYNNSNNED